METAKQIKQPWAKLNLLKQKDVVISRRDVHFSCFLFYFRRVTSIYQYLIEMVSNLRSVFVTTTSACEMVKLTSTMNSKLIFLINFSLHLNQIIPHHVCPIPLKIILLVLFNTFMSDLIDWKCTFSTKIAEYLTSIHMI